MFVVWTGRELFLAHEHFQCGQNTLQGNKQLIQACIAQSIAYRTLEQEVTGSIPWLCKYSL